MSRLFQKEMDIETFAKYNNFCQTMKDDGLFEVTGGPRRAFRLRAQGRKTRPSRMVLSFCKLSVGEPADRDMDKLLKRPAREPWS